MLTPQKIKNKNGTISFRAFVTNADGKRESKTFSTKQLAIKWGENRKIEIDREKVYGKMSTLTIRQVFERYLEKFSANCGTSKANDIIRLLRYDVVNVDIGTLSPKHIVDHCILRNKQAKPQTVAIDVSTLKTIISKMSAVDGFDYDPGVFDRAAIVLKSENLISKTDSRKRIPTWIELLKLSRHFRSQRKAKIPMFEIMWFAYFSARRLSEITRIEWADNNDTRQTGMVRDAKHPKEKKGNHRRFKYEKSAWKIAQRQSKTSEFIFPYSSNCISVNFINACKVTGIENLHFHDLRHAAATRLFNRGYAIEQVQQFTLHVDWRTLARYTHIKPEDID